MSEKYEHLSLPLYEATFERRKRGGGNIKPRINRKAFYEKQKKNIENIQRKHKEQKEKFKRYLDPELIFKVEIAQRVDEENFRKFMRKCGVKVLTPSPTGKGFWIVLAEDQSLYKLLKRLQEYGENARYKSIFDAIEDFIDIPPEEKIGEQLKKHPLKENEVDYLDVEVWRMEDEKLSRFLDDLEKMLTKKNGRITDKLVLEDICLLRVKMNKPTLEYILDLKEICRVDRLPKPYISYQMLGIPLGDFNIKGSPSTNAPAIAVIDSGIVSGHPLLKNAVGDATYFPLTAKSKIKDPHDDVGHGTKVAGIALYGDIKRCIEEEKFVPEIWILSGKVMYRNKSGYAEYDPEELLENQLERAVRYFVTNYPNCKVINLSIGDPYKPMFENRRQFPLATLTDHLAKELGIIFVISAGNLSNLKEFGYPDNYPDYLLEDKPEVKIIDPASSAFALTVGSVSLSDIPTYGALPLNIQYSPAKKDFPSPFTRVGPGYNNMIKPELVEEGGNVISDNFDKENIGGKIIVLNPKWVDDGKLFTVDFGTSFAAPKIAHYVAKLFKHFPDASPNLIKALLLASAEIPKERPEPLREIQFNSKSSNKELMKLLNVYGYGKPSFERALASTANDVLLIAQNKIKVDGIHIYYFYLPKEFILARDKEISVVLTYDPPVNRNRVDYLGVGMEFHLFYNVTIEDVINGYKQILQQNVEENVVPQLLKGKELPLKPGVQIRSRGIHQKGTIVYRTKEKPAIDESTPLVLVVISKDKWVRDESYLQEYAIVVRVRTKLQVNLYNKIKERIHVRARIKH